MKLLLDTHAVLWFLLNSPKLPPDVRALIEAPENDVAVCIASYWEVAIKQTLRKGDMPWTASVAALEHLATDQQIYTTPLTIDAVEHTKQLAQDHKDPFDRIIAATAVTTGLRLISSDSQMDLFVNDRIW